MAQPADRVMKTGDTFPPLIRVLEDDNGPIDLSTATGVRFIARFGSTKITDTCTTMTIGAALAAGLIGSWDPSTHGIVAAVKWDIDLGDTDIPGDYAFEFEITWAVGDIETMPNDRANNPTLSIGKDLDVAP